MNVVLWTKVKFGTIIHRSECLYDCVYIGVWSPTKTALLGGHRYFIFFIDDSSMCYCVYPMRQRFQVLDLFVKWKKLMEKYSSRKIKVLQFKKNRILRFGQNNCISNHFTVEKHGMAKEMNLPC